MFEKQHNLTVTGEFQIHREPKDPTIDKQLDELELEMKQPLSGSMKFVPAAKRSVLLCRYCAFSPGTGILCAGFLIYLKLWMYNNMLHAEREEVSILPI